MALPVTASFYFEKLLLLNFFIGTTYKFFPEQPLNCEQYGLVLSDHDPQWIALINQVITTEMTRETYRRWIGPILPALQRVKKYCDEREPVIDPTIPLQLPDTVEELSE